LRRGVAALAALLSALAAGSASAHEVRPAYLEIRELSPEDYAILWKVPARGEERLGLDLRLPLACASGAPASTRFAGGGYVELSRVHCAGGLAGRAVAIDGLAATVTDVLVRVERADGSAQITRLAPDAAAFVVESAPRAFEVVGTYLRLGVEHILTGFDHLAFVLGLLLLVDGFGRLLTTVSAFTLAHSMTLTFATLGVVHVPPPPVEAVIALSIVFVAREIVLREQSRPSLARERPWLVAFMFGLLHGLGFAGGLADAGLPAGHIPLALLWFSVGVEIGHFSFIAGVLALARLARVIAGEPAAFARVLPAYAIGAVASFWLIRRTASLFS
jgi:hydrogenase/urease accessory protein HupE